MRIIPTLLIGSFGLVFPSMCFAKSVSIGKQCHELILQSGQYSAGIFNTVSSGVQYNSYIDITDLNTGAGTLVYMHRPYSDATGLAWVIDAQVNKNFSFCDDPLMTQFDPVLAGQLWMFALTIIVGCWVVAKNAGLILNAIKRW